jgi:hypothetical protein
MLKRACISVAVLSFLVVLGLPIAQARTNQLMSVHAPFEFVLQDRVLAAGDYTVQQLTDSSVALRISSADNNESAGVLTNNAEAGRQESDAPRLVFRRYGDQYFLAAIWLNAESGRALIKSHRERSLQKELAASGHAREPEVITIAAEFAVR